VWECAIGRHQTACNFLSSRHHCVHVCSTGKTFTDETCTDNGIAIRTNTWTGINRPWVVLQRRARPPAAEALVIALFGNSCSNTKHQFTRVIIPSRRNWLRQVGWSVVVADTASGLVGRFSNRSRKLAVPTTHGIERQFVGAKWIKNTSERKRK